MTDLTLRRTEKNQVFIQIKEQSLNHGEFEWCEAEAPRGLYSDASLVSVLKHVPTGYFFGFYDTYVTMSPGGQRKTESLLAIGFVLKLEMLKEWLFRVRIEHRTLDLWATVAQEKALSSAVASTVVANPPFTPAEQKLIASKLDEITGFLVERQDFSEEQFETVNREIEYLKEASRRFGRKDWLTMLLGGLFSLILTLSVTPETAKGLMKLAGEAFQWLWIGMPMLGQ